MRRESSRHDLCNVLTLFRTVSAPKATAESTGNIFTTQDVQPTGSEAEPTLQPTLAPTIKDPSETGGGAPKQTGADTNPDDATLCARGLGKRCDTPAPPPYQEPTQAEAQQFVTHLDGYEPGSYVANDQIFNFLSGHVVVKPQKDQTILYIGEEAACC